MYRETAGSDWRAILPGDRVMPRLAGRRCETADQGRAAVAVPAQSDLPPRCHNVRRSAGADRRERIRAASIWRSDLKTRGRLSSWWPGSARTAYPGAAPSSSRAAARRRWRSRRSARPSWRCSRANGDLRRAFAALRQAREQNNHICVKLRASFRDLGAGREKRKLRRRASTLCQRLEGWGNCKATTVAGDPLEGAMSSVPGLALASTGTRRLWPCWAMRWRCCPGTAPPRPGSRAACCSGGPTARSGPTIRPADRSARRCSTSSSRRRAPARSVLANTINLGLCLSSAVLGSQGAKLPLIGKADIGPSAEGFVRLMQEALGPERRHEAIFVDDAVRRRLRSQRLRPAGRVPVSAAARACLPAEFPGPCHAAARHQHALRRHDADDRLRHRRGLSALHRGSRRIAETLSAGCRARQSMRPSPGTRSRCKHDEPWWRDVVDRAHRRSANIGWPRLRSAMPCRCCRT